MSNTITEAFVQQYSANVQMLSQQKGSLLRGVVDVESVVGKHAYFERIGAVSAQKRVSRHSDTPQIDKLIMSIKNSVNCWKIFFKTISSQAI